MNDIMSLLRSKYLALAQTLGDIEFQIHVLSKRRDELRLKMQSLDESAPDLKQFEKEITQNIVSLVKSKDVNNEKEKTQEVKSKTSGQQITTARST
jgi:citrate lyase gamma subunit